jgi:phosphonate degradation associated HDIG domain protein
MPPTTDAAETLRALFARKGAMRYGEDVTQLEHALQCATLASAAGDAWPLVLATLLHDVGHLVHRDAAHAYREGLDDRHEEVGARYLMRWFTPAVTEPISLHVEAKRYLCRADRAYRAALSPVSQRTLAMQGGPMSAEEAREFLAQPYAHDAIRLRRYDEAAKVPRAPTPGLESFLAVLAEA